MREAAARLLAEDERIVVAASGGADSLALLHACAAAAGGRAHARVVAATFDHGTGAHARAAVERVAAFAGRLGVPFATSRADLPGAGEAAWRRARYEFLRGVAARERARLATAHTADDQLETVVMRALRGAGARGLAGLYARSDVSRPLLALTRAEVHGYAERHELPVVDDPSNRDRRHLRNRLRLDLLPAIARVRPGFADEMLALARRAAAWRTEVDRLADGLVSARGPHEVVVARAGLAAYDSEEVAVLWPALAALVGATLDRRGTARLAAFTIEGRVGRRVQLSGGWEAARRGDYLVLRRMRSPRLWPPTPLRDDLVAGHWRFRRGGRGESAWSADLPADASLVVRPWRAGDRMRCRGAESARRVKRFLADARISGPERSGWPVVLADDEIVWIPGVRRSDAAAVRSGRPVVRYACERFDG